MSAFESVVSAVKTPAQFVIDKTLFSIPSYQRPYVWSDEAIKSLFDDLYGSYINNLPHYYVGTILTAQSKDGTFELIDGQQRTTSLMLLALACKKKDITTDLTQLICADKINDGLGKQQKRQLRLVFKIRDQVEAYLGHMAGLIDYDNQFPSNAEVKKNPYLKRLAGGLATFENLLDQIPHDEDCKRKEQKNTCEQQKFANYVYNNMRMVNNQIPRSTDLNQLFSTMNNSGIQLEQADILKSLLFKSISNKATYNAIWQACENMDNYFERNVRQVFPKTQWSNLDPIDFAKFDAELFLLKNIVDSEKIANKTEDLPQNDRGLTIAEIIEKQAELETSYNEGDSADTEVKKTKVYCKSIISFPQLLLHAYRIYLHQNELPDIAPRFHADQLINTFKPLVDSGDEEQIKAFIECLWQVRYAFDARVVKWVKKDGEEDEFLILSSVGKPTADNSYGFPRVYQNHSDLSLLQMVRHFTADRNAQYWLTSFLGWSVKHPKAIDSRVLAKMESIDNQLSLSKIEQKPASYQLLSAPLGDDQNNAKDYFTSYLNELKGVQFKHYWFQKLEYLLRKHRFVYLPSVNLDKFNKYRIISRNSVEHVHPQHEEHEKQLIDGYLDSFGNLALLNVSQNSSYSNQDVEKKRIDFYAKAELDSLKLHHIFDLMGTGKWDETKIKQHQQKMIELLIEHYAVES